MSENIHYLSIPPCASEYTKGTATGFKSRTLSDSQAASTRLYGAQTTLWSACCFWYMSAILPMTAKAKQTLPELQPSQQQPGFQFLLSMLWHLTASISQLSPTGKPSPPRRIAALMQQSDSFSSCPRSRERRRGQPGPRRQSPAPGLIATFERLPEFRTLPVSAASQIVIQTDS